MEKAILVRFVTVGTPAFADDDVHQIGYDNIETGYKLLVGEDADRFEEDGAPFDDGEVYREVKIVAQGEELAQIMAAVKSEGRA